MENIIDFISLLGGKRTIINLLFLLLFFTVVVANVKRNVPRAVVSLILALFAMLQITSLYFTQHFIGYRFYVHFNTQGAIGMIDLFWVQIILAIITFFLISLFFYFSPQLSSYLKRLIASKFNRINNHRSIRLATQSIPIIIVIIALSVMSFEKGVISEGTKLFSLLNTDTKKFSSALTEMGMEDYVSPKKLKAKKGKNIIVLSLESIEMGFLSEQMNHLTPNLCSLKNEWTFYEMHENEGSNWTSGSIYTSLTGFPAFFGVDGNSIFQSTYYSKISSISHTLKKANYDLTYMVGDARHSGLKDMLYSLKINNIIDQQNLGKNIKTEDDYGARDKDLFDRAKKEIEEKVSKNKPFALFLSTTDTHFPDGIYDERMEAYIPPQRSNLEFMVSAVDYMIGDLIEFLKKENALSNTSIYIYPDHLKMGDPTIFNESGDRALYLLTNASQDHIGVDTNELLFQLDLPKIILNGSNVKHNQKFLTDYIPNDTDKNEYVKNNILEIIALNTSGLLRINNNSQVNLKTELSKHYQEYKEDKSRFIAHAGGKIDGRTYTNSLEALNESYKKGFKLFELDIIKTKEGEYVAAHDWQQWADITNYKSDVPVSKEEFLNHKIFERYTPMSMDEINDWFKNHPDAILVTDKVNEPKLFSEQFIDKDRLMMELFTLEAVKEGLASNIKSAMPSQQIIESFGKNKLNQLKELGVTDVAFSRRYIVDNVDFLKQLKAEGIRSYVFHINFDPGIDEDYVVKYEMDYIYGIYADKWSFPAEDSVVNRAKKPISSK